MTEGLEEFLTRAITAGILNDQFRELLSLQVGLKSLCFKNIVMTCSPDHAGHAQVNIPIERPHAGPQRPWFRAGHYRSVPE